MTRRYTGGFISATEQATDSNTANGVFTLAEAQEKTALGNFPTGRWTPSRSVRFRSSNSNYLTRTPVYSGDSTKYTLSMWVKLGAIGDAIFFSAGPNTTSQTYMRFYNGASQALLWETDTSSTYNWYVQTSGLFRDPSAWYHLVFAYDSSLTGVTNQAKIYVNGAQATIGSSGSLGTNSYVNLANHAHYIGRQMASSNYFDGYMSEVNLIDGQTLDPTYFGTTDSQTGTWVPKRYTGTYGLNGFYLPFNTDATTYSADLLVVGGGGGGGLGGVATGGGGGGGYVSQTLTIIPSSTYTVTVGAGGPVGSNGNDSLLTSFKGAGGGKGGGYETAGSNGGSGGGAGGTSGTPAGGGYSGGGTLYSQGYAGGNTANATVGGAGGGGAGGAGTSSTANGNGQSGGSGATWTVNSTVYAGGGGGGNRAYDSGTGGSGGNGGGGRGDGTGGRAVAGSPNLGGGGGGCGFGSWAYAAAAGGSGVVIIRIPDTKSLTFSAGVTYSGGTASGGYKTYTVTATSTTSETVTFS